MDDLCGRCDEYLCEDGTDAKVMTSDLIVIDVCHTCQRSDDNLILSDES